MSTKSLKKTVSKVYGDLGIRTKYDPKKKYVFTSLKLTDDLENVNMYVDISKRGLTFITFYPQNAEKKILNQVCNDALNLNYHMVMGSYDVDRTDGEVRFRSTLYMDGSEPSEKIVKKHILLGLYSVKHFHDEIWLKYHAPVNKGEAGLPNEEQTYVARKDKGSFDPMIN